MIIYEGVTFITERCLPDGKKSFIRKMMPVYWQDRDEKTRRKMLENVWELMQPQETETTEE